MGTKNQAALLKQINDGESVFAPNGETEDAMREFQPLALELIELDKRGLIEMKNPVRENRSGHNFIVRIWGCNLTYTGLEELG